MTLSAVLSGGAVLVGAWLVFAPRLLEYAPETAGAAWNQTVMGAIIVVTSLIRYFRPRRLPVLSWVAAAAGGWLLISPLVLYAVEFPASASAFYNDVIAGLLVIVLAGGSGLRTLRESRQAQATSPAAGT